MKIYNIVSKRNNTVKTALNNGLLTNPDNFKVEDGYLLVKDNNKYKLVKQSQANKYIKNSSDILAVNRGYIFNPQTKRVIKNNKRNVKKVKTYKALQKVKYISNPDLAKMRKELQNINDKNINIEYIINDNVILSKYYNNFIYSSKKWHKTALDWIINSEEDIFTKYNNTGKLFIYEPVSILTSKKINQFFKEGITNCLLTPIKEWIDDKIIDSKSHHTVNKYKQKKIVVDNMLKTYVNGVPETDIDKICNDLQIDISIEIPFNDKTFINCKSTKKALNKFKFINTRLNHVDNVIVNNNNIEYLTQQEINNKYTELLNSNDFFTFTRNNYEISTIKTVNKYYIIKDDFNIVCNNFELETGLNNCKIDDVEQQELSEFIAKGTHYNGTVDFMNVYDNNNKLLLNWEDYIHIDMEKAYANFFKCSVYDGFLGKITDFRETDKIEGVGIYQIYNLSFINCNDKFKKYNDKLKIYVDNGIYTSPELKYLEKMGVSFNIVSGCWGVEKLDFRFNDEMLNSKTDNGIKYYAKYAGLCDCHNMYKTYRMKESIEYAQLLKANTNDLTVVDYDTKNEEIIISYHKQYNYHLGHITAFLTAYQRISTLEQLMELEYNNIVRVCVDGIYFKNQAYKLKNCFRTDKKGNFNNMADRVYISNNDMNVIGNFNDKRLHYKKELHLGCGGCGKTHSNLIDKGLIKPLFIAPSWKLAIDKKENYGVNVSVWARLLSNDPEKINYIKKTSNVLIIDEVSMMTESQKQYIFDTYKNMKIIMCGDLGYQLPPINASEEMDSNGFDYIKNDYGESRRFKCEELRSLCNDLRKFIKEDYTRFEINNYVNKYFDSKNKLISSDDINYSVKDMILTGTNKHKNYFTNKYKGKFDNEKYYVLENNRNYQNGCIVIGDKPENTKCEVRHAFTTHSIQGETANNHLFIDNSKMFDARMFYTAISRARTLEQITIVKPSSEMLKNVK